MYVVFFNNKEVENFEEYNDDAFMGEELLWLVNTTPEINGGKRFEKAWEAEKALKEYKYCRTFKRSKEVVEFITNFTLSHSKSE